jgi:hypothetical protein
MINPNAIIIITMGHHGIFALITPSSVNNHINPTASNATANVGNRHLQHIFEAKCLCNALAKLGSTTAATFGVLFFGAFFLAGFLVVLVTMASTS